MKRLLFLIIILFISISAVSAADNLTDSVLDDADSFLSSDADVLLENDSGGDSNPTEPVVTDDKDNSSGNATDDNSPVDAEGNASENNSTEVKLSIKGNDLVWYIKANPTYKFKIVDSNGKGVAVNKVKLTLKGKNYFVNTDANGNGKFSLKNLNAGTYDITATYENLTVKNKIKLFSSRITGRKDISTVYGKKVKYSFKLVDNSGKPMVGKTVKITVGKKTYKPKTDSKGFASVQLNYNSGKYTIKYNADGLTGSNKYTVKNYIKLDILKWGLTGDVSKASLIKKNMPNNVWVKKAVAATKKGLPLLTVKGGNGKVVFMTAGVHGNELNSQVAAMKMIKYLTTHPIKGTVYMIPFVNVKAISQHVRLTNYDFNRVAHKSGTVSNKIINLILKKKCDAYGDFHTTVSPGVPGINVVLGYTSPKGCVPMTNYIAKYAGVSKIFYYPGQKYQWSLADYCNQSGKSCFCKGHQFVLQADDRIFKIQFNNLTEWEILISYSFFILFLKISIYFIY